MLGYGADGFPILYSKKNAKPSYKVKSGNRPGGYNAPSGKYDGTYTQDYEYVSGLGDLDECNGKAINFAGFTYAYFLTKKFPLVPRCFKGTPDSSFARKGPGPGGNRRGRPPRHHRGDMPPPPHHRHF